MNLGDKKRSVTVRLTDSQFDFLAKSATMLGVTPSNFLRMVINTAIYSQQALLEGRSLNLEDMDEHSKADFVDFVQH